MEVYDTTPIVLFESSFKVFTTQLCFWLTNTHFWKKNSRDYQGFIMDFKVFPRIAQGIFRLYPKFKDHKIVQTL